MPSARPSGVTQAFDQHEQEPDKRDVAPTPGPVLDYVHRSRMTRVACRPWPVLQRSWLLLVVADLMGLLTPAFFRADGRLVLTGYAVMCLLLQEQTGMYRARLHLSVLNDAPTLLSRDLAAAVVLSAGIQLLHLRPAVGAFSQSVLVAMGAHLLLRYLAYRWIGAARARGRFSYPTLILGGGLVAAQLATTLQDMPQYGLRPIGFLDVDPLLEPTGGGPMPHLGEFRDVRRVLAERSVQVVLVAFGNLPESAMMRRASRDGSRFTGDLRRPVALRGLRTAVEPGSYRCDSCSVHPSAGACWSVVADQARHGRRSKRLRTASRSTRHARGGPRGAAGGWPRRVVPAGQGRSRRQGVRAPQVPQPSAGERRRVGNPVERVERIQDGDGRPVHQANLSRRAASAAEHPAWAT